LAIAASPFRAAWRGTLSVFAVAAFLACAYGCASQGPISRAGDVPELRPGVLAGYLPADQRPDSLRLVPPPPAPGSQALAADEEAARANLAKAGTPRWQLAVEDANLKFPQAAETFSCALGVPINERDTPQLYLLLRRSLVDAGLSTYRAKEHYRRQRPFLVNHLPTCTPDDVAKLAKDGSYPSGHNAAGWAWALILTEVDPERADAILARGLAYGQSRLACNVHWQSDANQGRIMGAATVARLHADPTFRANLAAARTEVAAARAKGLKPTRDCAAERAALGQ